jgi:4-hydroxyphenylpyruvate dioxygenase-like putative hemolysin
MSDLFENPMGLDGFEFVEFTAEEKGILEPAFTAMGFTMVATHKSLIITQKNMALLHVDLLFALKMLNLPMLKQLRKVRKL